jgi:outer membrane protein OmpA-like peptidoglycan-associated protein
MDIWVSERIGLDKWGPAINLGPKVNTEWDDDVPTLSVDGKILYFSSKGHFGMGGYDIFRSKYDDNSQAWSEPINIGYPVNSPDNDSYFTQGRDTLRAYYASVKDIGVGDMDIFLLEFEKDQFKAPDKEMEKELASIISDSAQKAARTGSGISRNIASTDKVENGDDDEGSVKGKKGKNLLAINAKKKNAKKTKVVNKSKGSTDTEDTDVTEDSGLSAEGIAYIPFKLTVAEGRSKKIMDAEVKIVDDITGEEISAEHDRLGSYSAKVQKGSSYTVTIEKPGFMFKNFKLSVPKAAGKLVSRKIFMSEAEMNGTIVLRNIYFDFGTTRINAASNNELRLLERYMKQNSNAIVQITGHTDSRGGEDYNQKLSLERSEAIIKLMVARGIKQDRMVARGLGEMQPLASNDDESEGRELNRRTEFELISNKQDIGYRAIKRVRPNMAIVGR